MRRIARVGGAALAVLLLAGCAGHAAGQAGSSQAGAQPSRATKRTLTVFAAASLTATFDRLGARFEKAHPGVTVDFDYDGSSTLVQQLAQGAPADVFASADEKNMQAAVAQKSISGTPVDFATNILEIATPPGNPAGIRSFADLAKPGVKVVVCADGVPCGNATEQVEKNTGVTLSPVSEEQSVTAVLAKVESGDADAGLVYVTDVTAAGSKVDGVRFPEASDVVNTYPIAVTEGTKQEALAKQFVDFVTSAAGQKVLRAAGFGAP
ncbi:molybdate ABC transporter substrate-binding protein [Gryllotalpicola ginsengisoli]|uniref:molybdate ABC transporter substrate-binding protein n=1 Tax=Gryllotalpicola ginsengisoli TaxID=444608 RepID=UPI0003B665A5|nr:molybdate ABC transporter substrate-binding protein [Gryllotalpicola ginsengisoli]